jgi:heme-degrading monooxygenase HmoA
MRYARKIDFNLKMGQEKEFNKVFESKIVPVLQKQKGFQDEILLTSGHQVTAISLWDTKAHAETYAKEAYPKLVETLKPFFETTPKVINCEVPFTTMHALA